MQIGKHDVQAGLHDAHRAPGEHGALVVEPGHQHPHALVFAAEDVLRRHLAVGEHQLPGVGAAHAQLVELLGAGEAGKIALDEKGGDAPGAGVGLGLRIDHIDVGVGAVGDPHLVAVEHETVAPALGAEFHAHHVRAGTGLAHRQGADVLAAAQPGQVPGFLFGRAVLADLVDAQVGVGAVGETHRGGGTGDLLHGHHMGQVAHTGAAELLLDGDAQQAQITELAPQVAGEVVVAVDGLGAGGDLLQGEALDGVAKLIDVGAEIEVEAVEHSSHGGPADLGRGTITKLGGGGNFARQGRSVPGVLPGFHGPARFHAGGNVVADMTVIQPGARVVRDHVHRHHGGGQ